MSVYMPLAALLLMGGCSMAAGETDAGETADEASPDNCELNDLYGDGICDRACPLPDPDCDGAGDGDGDIGDGDGDIGDGDGDIGDGDIGDGDGDGDGDEEVDGGACAGGACSTDGGDVGGDGDIGDGDGDIPDGCGDGFRDPQEVCDGDALHGQTCSSQGFTDGELGCAANCQAFDTSACSICGDGVIEGDEVCDGEQLDGATCSSLGFSLGGDAACSNDCSHIVATGCNASFTVPDVGLSFDAPVIDSTGRIYTSAGGETIATNPDGSEAWRLDDDGDLALVSDDRLMRSVSPVGSANASIIAVNRGGATIWSYTVSRDYIFGIAVGRDGTTYALGEDSLSPGFGNHRLFAVDPAGDLAWTFDAPALSAPTVADDGALYATSDGEVLKLSAAGQLLDTFSCAGLRLRSRPVLGDDGALYLLADDGECTEDNALPTLAAISAQGTCLWTRQLHEASGCDWNDAELLVGEHAVYVEARYRLHAVDFDGEELWEAPITISPRSMVLSDAGEILVGGLHGIEAISADGHRLWKRSTPGTVYSLTLGESDTLYAAAYPDLIVLPLERGLQDSAWPRDGRTLNNTYAAADSLCGNGQLDPFELCDGELLGGATCAGGTLSCASSCFAYDTSQCPVGGLIFSEIVEGSSNNKAIEIANLGDLAVDVSTCSVERYNNGALTPTDVWDLPAQQLAGGDVLVACHTSVGDALLPSCDQMAFAATNFNGDDALVLTCGGQVQDRFGRVGEDPGTEWGSGDIVTVNRTLRRKSSVEQGDTNPTAVFDPAAEWDSYPSDTFSGLGTH